MATLRWYRCGTDLQEGRENALETIGKVEYSAKKWKIRKENQVLIFFNSGIIGILVSGIQRTVMTNLPSWQLSNMHYRKRLWCWEGLGREEKGTAEDEMAGWHHRLDGRGSGWTPGVGDGQGGLACCDAWGRKESDMTERLIWSDLIWYKYYSNSFQMSHLFLNHL